MSKLQKSKPKAPDEQKESKKVEDGETKLKGKFNTFLTEFEILRWRINHNFNYWQELGADDEKKVDVSKEMKANFHNSIFALNFMISDPKMKVDVQIEKRMLVKTLQQTFIRVANVAVEAFELKKTLPHIYTEIVKLMDEHTVFEILDIVQLFDEKEKTHIQKLITSKSDLPSPPRLIARLIPKSKKGKEVSEPEPVDALVHQAVKASMESSKKENRTLRQQLQKATEELKVLRVESAGKAEAEQSSNDKSKTIQKLKKEMADYKKSLSDKTHEVERTTKTIKTLTEEKKSLQRKYQEAEGQIEEIKMVAEQHIKKNRQEMRAMQGRNEKIQKEKEEIQKTNEEIQKEYYVIQKFNEKNQREKDELQQLNNALQVEKETLQREKDEMLRKYMAIQKEKDEQKIASDLIVKRLRERVDFLENERKKKQKQNVLRDFNGTSQLQTMDPKEEMRQKLENWEDSAKKQDALHMAEEYNRGYEMFNAAIPPPYYQQQSEQWLPHQECLASYRNIMQPARIGPTVYNNILSEAGSSSASDRNSQGNGNVPRSINVSPETEHLFLRGYLQSPSLDGTTENNAEEPIPWDRLQVSTDAFSAFSRPF